MLAIAAQRAILGVWHNAPTPVLPTPVRDPPSHLLQPALVITMSSEDSPAEPIKLTVVIIGRNEEQFIAKSIRSSLAAAPLLPGVEVIFVDSASTDRSVEIATEFPIRILQLKPDWPLCVAAGRYTGFLHSRGEYILFLDGDAEAEADWLARAVAFMDENPEYGAIAGVLGRRVCR